MISFQKNPFTTNKQVRFVGTVKQFDDKEKISNIKKTMAKLKNKTLKTDNQELNVNDKVNILKDIDRFK